jgi:hypothetical protein
MPDSEPPRGRPAPAEPDLLRTVAELESETAELLAEVREHIRRSRDLRREARVLRDSLDGTARGP